MTDDPLILAIEDAIDRWWGGYDPRPSLPEAIAAHIRACGQAPHEPTRSGRGSD